MDVTISTRPLYVSNRTRITSATDVTTKSLPNVTNVTTILTLTIVYGDFGLWLYNKNGMYEIYTSMGENSTTYSYPITTPYLSFDGNYTINQQTVNMIQQTGTVTPPHWLQRMLTTINSSEPFQLCYDFSTERILLNVGVGFLVVLLLASHGTKISTIVGALGRDLQQSKITRRLSWSRSSVAGSETSYTTVKKETSI